MRVKKIADYVLDDAQHSLIRNLKTQLHINYTLI